MENKICSRCKIRKPIDEFYIMRRYGRIDHQCKCKNCQSIIKYTKSICECGKQYTYTHKQRHLRSSYHNKRVPLAF